MPTPVSGRNNQRQMHISVINFLWLEIFIAAALKKDDFVKSSHCTWSFYCYNETRPSTLTPLFVVKMIVFLCLPFSSLGGGTDAPRGGKLPLSGMSSES